MNRPVRWAALLALAGALACSDSTPTGTRPTLPTTGAPAATAGTPDLGASTDRDHARLERLARRVARAMRRPQFRQAIKTQLDRSPFVEHKVQFQSMLRGNSRALLRELATGADDDADSVAADADNAMALEMYFPVAAHRAAWAGDENILVATAIADHEVPVAYDVNGRRHLLDPNAPPAIPVLALEPVETDFDAAPAPAGPAFQTCQGDACGGGGGGGGGGGVTGSPPIQGLYLTHAQYVQDFEGWFKGSPEFEIHIMGPASATDSSLVTYQCIGEHAPAPYTWDENTLTWDGSQLLFSTAQMDAYERAHPGKAYVLLALEDDDTPCVIKAGTDRGAALLAAVDQAYRDYKGAKDSKVLTPNGVTRIIKAAKSGSSIFSALANLIKTNDDLIGIIVADSVSGRLRPGTNWTAQDDKLASNAWFNLVMK